MFKGYVFTILTVIIWGMEYVLVKIGTAELPPIVIGTIIFSISSSLLGLTVVLRKEMKTSPIRQNIKKLIAIGIVGATLNLCWLYGTKFTTVANASILSRMEVLFSLGISYMIFHQKIRMRTLWVLPLMLFGTFLVIEDSFSKFSFGNSGDYLILLNCFLVAVNAFIIKATVERNVSGVVVGFVNTFINFIMFMILMMLFKEPISFEAVSPGILWAMVACGICSYLFFMCYYAGLKYLPVWEVRVLLLGLPIVAIIGGWLCRGSVPSSLQVLGGLFIIIGAAGIIVSSGAGKIPSSLKLWRDKQEVKVGVEPPDKERGDCPVLTPN